MTDRRKFAWLRIAFGAIWGIDAYFKWQPAFFANFTSYLTGNLDGQPALVRSWIGLWVHIVGVNPQFFAFAVAAAETAIALALLTGVAPRLATSGGIAMSLVIWSTAEGFGGPYAAGSTDIGTAVIYVLVFLALWFGRGWEDLRLIWRWRHAALYRCRECGLHYRDRAWARKCEAWCREHRSCNIAITAHAEENQADRSRP